MRLTSNGVNSITMTKTVRKSGQLSTKLDMPKTPPSNVQSNRLSNNNFIKTKPQIVKTEDLPLPKKVTSCLIDRETTRFQYQPEQVGENNPHVINQLPLPSNFPKINAEFKNMGDFIAGMETPRVQRHQVREMVITEDDEAVIRHKMAQELVELINQNEKNLNDTQYELNKFVCEGKVSRSIDT